MKTLQEFELNEKSPVYDRGDAVIVPHKGKMVDGKVVRYDKGRQDSVAFYVVAIPGVAQSISVPTHKIRNAGKWAESVEEGRDVTRKEIDKIKMAKSSALNKQGDAQRGDKQKKFLDKMRKIKNPGKMGEAIERMMEAFNEKKWTKAQWASKGSMKWWEKTPEELRAEIYHSKGQLPPPTWDGWDKIVDQMNSNPKLKQHGGKAPGEALKRMRNYKGKK